MADAVERTDCGRCGGSGQVMKEVAGRSGYVPCSDCDNPPKFAMPDEVPEDPAARIEEIEDRMDELREEREEWKRLSRDLREAKDLLADVANHDLTNEEDAAVLSHIARQIGHQRFDRHEHGIHQRREQLGRERAQLRDYLDAIEGRES